MFILADDLGYADLGCYGQRLISTPHIDSLARGGMRFTEFYAGCSVSAPSRAALMTGKHTGHTTIRGNKEVLPEGQAPMAQAATLATLLRDSGYSTGLFGKWGLGYPNSGAEPLDRGFDTFYGYNCQRQAHSYYPEHLWSDRERELIPGNAHGARQTYVPDLIQARALSFIKDAARSRQPFFAMLTYTLPHAELNLPHDSIYRHYHERLEPKPWEAWHGSSYASTPDARASFAAMVARLDRHVGELMTALKELGVHDDTLIIFTSDNGPHEEGGADPDYFDSNGPLRGHKRDLYEGGIRVPMIAAWPRAIRPGSVSSVPAAFWDILPTYAELLGQKVSSDGVSLWSMLTEDPRAATLYERPLYWEFHEEDGRMALRRGKFKLVALGVSAGEPTYELYDLSTDQGEARNLAAERPELVRELAQLMRAMRTPSALFPFAYERAAE